jgi:hypothetical protein
MVFRSHPIGACCVRSGRLQGFIPQKLAHFEEHILTLHTACACETQKGLHAARFVSVGRVRPWALIPMHARLRALRQAKERSDVPLGGSYLPLQLGHENGVGLTKLILQAWSSPTSGQMLM